MFRGYRRFFFLELYIYIVYINNFVNKFYMDLVKNKRNILLINLYFYNSCFFFFYFYYNLYLGFYSLILNFIYFVRN